jgi:hypothetical protein
MTANAQVPTTTAAPVVTAPTRTGKLDQLRALVPYFNESSAEIGQFTPYWEDFEQHDGIISRKLTEISLGEDENLKKWKVTDRFMNSFCSKFGIGANVFKYFTPDEVFARVQRVHPRTQVRIVTNDGPGISLACSSPSKAYVDYQNLMLLLGSPSHIANIMDVNYENGIVTSVHKMRDPEWDVNGDIWQQTFTLATPIDGYGLPDIYISLNRRCNNARLTAVSKTFKSQVQLGKDSDRPEIPLNRAMESYNNEEGYQAIRQRLAVAWDSMASLYEVDALYRAIKTTCRRANTSQWVWLSEKYYNMTGDPSDKYAIVSGDSISPKKARMLNMNCTVYDLVCFASELLTTRRALIENPNAVNRWIANLFDNEYDLEGTREELGHRDYAPREFYLEKL